MGDVLGIDLSMTSTGVAKVYRNPQNFLEIHTDAIKSKGTRNDTLADRAFRIKDLRSRICSWVTISTELALIESPSFGSKGAGTWDRAGLWWAVTSWLSDHDVPTALVSPLSLKKYWTGSGKADKPAMAEAFEKVFGWKPKTTDEADAGALAHLGALSLQTIDLPVLDWHHTKDVKAEWP